MPAHQGLCQLLRPLSIHLAFPHRCQAPGRLGALRCLRAPALQVLPPDGQEHQEPSWPGGRAEPRAWGCSSRTLQLRALAREGPALAMAQASPSALAPPHAHTQAALTPASFYGPNLGL